MVAKSKKTAKPKERKESKLKFILIGILLAVISGVGSFFAVRYLAPLATPAEETVQTAENSVDPKEEAVPEGEWVVSPEKPRYMSIPKLGIDKARVVELGTKGENNQLEDPQNIHDAGWYRESALPGAPTDTTYAGLYDGHNTGINQKGIFYTLGRLVTGDTITIERGDGATFNYTVQEVETPLLEEVDMAKMQKSFDPAVEGLNIITCGGDWDKGRQTYTHRVTVRAILQT
jgi:sortase (surface protein transpeptidase)